MKGLCEKLLKITRDGVLQYTLDDGEILYANQGLVKILDMKCKPEELKGIHVKDILFDEDTEKKIKNMLTRKREIHEIEYQYKTQKEEDVWITLDASTMEDHAINKKTVLSIVKDITRHKKLQEERERLQGKWTNKIRGLLEVSKEIEEELDKSEQKYQSLVEKTGAGIATADLKRRFTFVNDAFCKMIGYSKEELIGKPFADFVHPDDKKRIPQIFWNVLKNPKKYIELEFRVIHKKGHIVYMHSIPTPYIYKGKILGFNAIISDITERKKAEKTLRESEEELNTIFNGVREGIAVFDRTGRILKINKRILEVSGYTEETFVGKRFKVLKMFPPKSIAKMIFNFSKVIAGKDVPRFDVEVYTKAGKKLITELQGSPLRKNGKIVGMIGVMRDITERKQAEESLRESEAKYSTLVEQAKDGVVIVQDEVFKFANRTMAEISGYEVEEIVGMNFLEMVVPESKNLIAQRYKLRMCGKKVPSIYEARIKCKDRKIRNVELSGGIIQYQGRPADIGFVRDITDRKRAQEALRDKEARYRELANSITDIFFAMNKELHYTYWNKASEELTGIAAKNAIGKSIFELFPDNKDTRRVVKVYKEVLKTKKPQTFVNGYKIAGKEYFFEISVYPSMDGISVFVKDITERKKADDTLRESEDLLSQVIDINPNHIFIKDRDCKYVMVNKAVAILHGISKEAMVGKTDLDFISKYLGRTEEINRVRADDLEVIESKKPKFIPQELLTLPDGSIKWFQTTKVPLTIKDDPDYILGVAFDITERKKAEEALSQRVKELATLQETVLDITTPYNLPKLLQTIVERAARLLNTKAGGMYLCYPDRREVQCVVSYNTPRDYRGIILKYGEGSAGIVAQTGKPLLIDNYRKWLSRATVFEEEQPFTSVLSAPMVWQDQVIGVIHILEDVEERHFTKDDLELLTLFANHASIAVENTRLLEHLQDYTKELESQLVERKKAEEALRESEEKLQRIFECISDGITVTNLNGVIIDLNEKALQLNGAKSKSDLIGKSSFETIAPQDQVKALERMKGLLQLGIFGSEEFNLVRADNSIYPAEISANLLKDNAGNPFGFVNIIRDITERKQVEEELSYERYLLNTLIDNIPDNIYFKDNNSRFIRINKALADRIGVSNPLQAIGKSDYDFFTKEYADKTYKDEMQVMKTGKPLINKEESYVFPDFGEKWFTTTKMPLKDESGKTIGTFGVSREITDIKKVEKTLREREREIRLIAENVPALFSYLDANAHYRFVNKQYRKWFGITQKNILGKHYRDVLGEATYELIKNRVNAVLSGKQVKYVDALPYKYGGTRWVIANYVPDLDDQGKIRGFFALVTDITEHKRAEEKLRQNQIFLDSIVENIPDMIFVKDAKELRFKLFNKAGVKLLGYKRKDIINKNDYDFFPKKQADFFTEKDREVLRSCKLKDIPEEQIKTKGGERILHTKKIPIFNEEGNEIYLLGISEDITERKRAEEALQDSEEKHRAIFKQASESIALIDAETGALVEFNDSAHKNLGYSYKEFKKLKIHDFEAIESEEEVANHIKKIKMEGSDLFETKHKTKEGKIRDILISSKAITIRERKYIQSIWYDITERKRAEEALRESEEKFRNLAEQTPNMIFINKKGRVVYANKKSEEVMGYKREEFYSHDFDFLDLIAPESKELVKTNYSQHLIGKEVKPYEFAIITKKGRRIDAISTTKLINYEGDTAILGIVTDITERKKAEEEIRTLSQFRKSIIDNANVWLNVLDAEGNIVLWNKAAERISGYSRKDVIGHGKIWEWLYPDKEYRNDIIEKANSIIEKGEVVEDVETNIQRKDGKNRIISWHSRNLVDKKGTPIGSIALGRDITELKKAEEALQESRQRYYTLFEYSPISLWEEDFSKVKKYIDQLKDSGIKNFRTFFDSHPETVYDCVSKVKVIDINKATLDLYKGKNKEHILSNLHNIFTEETYSVFKDELIAIAEGKTVLEFESSAKTIEDEIIHNLTKWAVAPGYEDTLSKVFVSAIDLTEQKQTLETLQRSREQLRNLTAHLESVKEEERKSIAREIHDELGQSLTALKMDISWLCKKLPKKDKIVVKKTESMNNLIDTTVQTVKKISSTLRPSLIDDLGLAAAIEWQSEEYQKRTGTQCTVTIGPEDIPIKSEYAITIFRIFQEALTNITRHSGATEVNVKLLVKKGNLLLNIKDNGKGITKEQIEDPESFGLHGILERAHYCGGEVKISGIKGKGTTVKVRIPVGK